MVSGVFSSTAGGILGVIGLMRYNQEETIAVSAVTIMKRSKPSWLFYPLEFHSSYTDTCSVWGCTT